MKNNIYFSSDHHFEHFNIIRYCNRPFKNLNEMNHTMVRRWNEVVQKDDLVYYLGDFSLSFQAAEHWLPKLNGKKILVQGNHDRCHPVRKRDHEFYQREYLRIGFESLHLEMKVEIPLNGKLTKVKLHHLPYSGPPQGDKYARFRPKDTGDILLCGHVHDSWAKVGRMVNVGVDVNNFYPMSIADIERRLLGPDSKSRDSQEYKDSL